MSFDCSRFSFDPLRDYFGVVMQQGRVQLDSDWNEWLAELARRLQAGTLDTLGRAVVPRETPDGFLIDASGGTLSIGPGRIYVDGLLAENHGGPPSQWDPALAEQAGSTPLGFFDQPYLPFNSVDQSAPADVFNRPVLADGPHLAYLDLWQRALTRVQAPDLVDPAVGVDTTGRIQTAWQVRLLPDVGDIDCSTPDAEIPGWLDLIRPSGGRLTTSTGSVPGQPNPCLVPPAAGYKGLENQFYRVEIHRGGGLGTATFKWSRDNATVATRVTEIQPGNRLVVESIGPDELLGLHAGDWVEVLDDWHELHGLPGPLRRIRPGDGVDADTRSIVLEDALPAGLFPVDGLGHTSPDRHTRLRRWDQSGLVLRADGSVFHDLDASASSEGIPVAPAGTALALESGILMELALEPGGGFRSGDYWVFAARTANGSIELLDQSPPLGIHHHYARLSLVTLPDTELDCRTLYPPLCACGTCTFTVAPGPNWGEVFSRVPEGGDAEICFQVGDYPLPSPLIVPDKGHLKLTGVGPGTRILAPGAEQALLFRNCTSVLIEDLSAETGVAGSDSAGSSGLTGTLSFEMCGAVTLHRVTLQCATAVVRSAACLRVLNNVGGDREFADLQQLRGTLDVQGCRFEVGSNQIGALVINGARVLFRNNAIRCRDGRTEAQQIAAGLATDAVLRAEVRRTLFADVRPGDPEDLVGGDTYNAFTNRRTMSLGNVVVEFRSHPELEEIRFYDRLFPEGTPEVGSVSAADDALQDAVDAVLLDPDRIARFRPIFAALLADDLPALYQGIAIGGEEAEEVRIQDNTILDALQGVHIGQSRRNQPPGERLRSTVVTVEGNTIDSRIAPAVNREAYGVYIGNCDSLLVLGNRLRREAIASTAHLRMDGVHVVGALGGRIIVRHNEVLGYSVRINSDIGYGADLYIDPEPSPRDQPLWLVADNLAAVVEADDPRVMVVGNFPGV